MVAIYRLYKEDIQDIIAEHFHVDKNKVDINCYMDTVGYGMNEHVEPAVYVEVRGIEKKEN